uniref:Sulfhydryl oxidase n=1 Tax=Hyaloperonospora arabidopsidis (strain Emoy2) TaxID=559515 RepID=M4B9B5_HYAAE
MSDPNCVEPACADKLSFFKMSAGKKKTKKEATNPEVPKDCPLDRQELGAATWGLLHSMGIYYPEKPSPEYQAKAKSFIETLALMYPCVHCAEDFQKEVAKSPPRVESRTTFSMWLCEQHNIVNRKLHKPVFECTISNLEERWRKGKPSCWSEDGDEGYAQETLR